MLCHHFIVMVSSFSQFKKKNNSKTSDSIVVKVMVCLLQHNYGGLHFFVAGSAPCVPLTAVRNYYADIERTLHDIKARVEDNFQRRCKMIQKELTINFEIVKRAVSESFF